MFTQGLSKRLPVVAMEPAALVDPRGRQGTVLFYIQSNPAAESLQALPFGQSCPSSLVPGPHIQSRACLQRGGSRLEGLDISSLV